MSAPVELIKHVPLFHGLNDKQLKALANNFTERTFREGQELTAEGQGGAGFFVIESGDGPRHRRRRTTAGRSGLATTSARSR